MSYSELHGLSKVGDQTLLVGRATRDRSQNKHLWNCEALVQNKGMTHLATSYEEAVGWLKKFAGAAEVYDSDWVPETV